MTPSGRLGLRYVALGDSYTIGTAVDPVASWPAQLVAALTGAPGPGGSLELVANLAVNGRAQYRLWVERIAPVVADLLAGSRRNLTDRRA